MKMYLHLFSGVWHIILICIFYEYSYCMANIDTRQYLLSHRKLRFMAILTLEGIGAIGIQFSIKNVSDQAMSGTLVIREIFQLDISRLL